MQIGNQISNLKPLSSEIEQIKKNLVYLNNEPLLCIF